MLSHGVLAHGNAKVDRWCELARHCSRPGDVLIPTSPSLGFLCYKGKMITASPAIAARRILREQASAQLQLRAAQGKLVSLRN